jgi:acetylornithine deacetylase
MDVYGLACDIVDRYWDEIVQVVRDLVHIPSQNKPPIGEEKACQEYISSYLERRGFSPMLYEPDQVPGMVGHPDYWPGRSYKNRPNLTATLQGQGGGHSLLLTGHCDTVALGENTWSKPPFGAEIHDGQLYGLGAADMKGGLGATMVMFAALAHERVPLLGKVVFESVVDEEEAGVNSTLAGRLRDGLVDGAMIVESTGLEIHHAARGALLINFYFSAEGTWLEVGKNDRPQLDAVAQIGTFITQLEKLRAVRRQVSVPEIYRSYPDPVPVQVTKVYAGGWGSEVPIAVPPIGRIELIVQALPGEERAAVLRQVEEWLDWLVAQNPTVYPSRPRMEFARRWMHPSTTPANHPLVTTLSQSVAQVAGAVPVVRGGAYNCDIWALQRTFQIPAVVFGPKGANSHAADEHLDLASLRTFAEALLDFACHWCGIA